MKRQPFHLLLLLTLLPILLTACVAEQDFPKENFDSVPPDVKADAAPDSDEPEVVKAGPVYKAKFETSKGDFIVEVRPEWSPGGAAQFKAAIEDGVYNDARFFRVLPGFMAQFGIAGDPAVSAKWREKTIPDEPVMEANTRGMLTYAKAGPNSRTTQVFINFGNNSDSLDPQGFSPFGKVIEGMEVIDSLYAEYGEGAPQGNGPNQGRIQSEGNAYLAAEFPKLDYIKQATILTE